MRTTSQRRVRQLHELLKLVSHSIICTSGASWSRQPSSWTGALGARKCVGVGRGDVLPTTCTIHEASYTVEVLSLHALSCTSVSLPSVTRATLLFLSARARPQFSLSPEKTASGSASMLSWHKFFYTAGVSSSCDMVVKRGPSEGLSLIYTHSSINAFAKSLVGIFLQTIDPLPLFLLSGVIKCWCGTIATKLSQALERDSHDRCRFFPRGRTFSMVTTLACCPRHLGRVTSTSAVGRMEKLQGEGDRSFYVTWLRIMGFLPKANAPFFALS